MATGVADSPERQRFVLVYESCYEAVYAYAARRVDTDLAGDVVADTFLVAWRRRDRIPETPLPWLYGIARRVIANHRRSQRRTGALVYTLGRQMPRPPNQVGEGSSVGRALPNPVLAAFQMLSTKEREVLALTAWEELRPFEAAAVMGCSAAAFRVRLHRARQHFRSELQRQGSPDLPKRELATPAMEE